MKNAIKQLKDLSDFAIISVNYGAMESVAIISNNAVLKSKIKVILKLIQECREFEKQGNTNLEEYKAKLLQLQKEYNEYLKVCMYLPKQVMEKVKSKFSKMFKLEKKKKVE